MRLLTFAIFAAAMFGQVKVEKEAKRPCVRIYEKAENGSNFVEVCNTDSITPEPAFSPNGQCRVGQDVHVDADGTTWECISSVATWVPYTGTFEPVDCFDWKQRLRIALLGAIASVLFFFSIRRFISLRPSQRL